uniref:Guanine nucleotide exchange factor DBS n=1 Tax=Romanomermis culicivorax TaxID=13658 RepID=A0A915JCJ1_ROMCU
MRSSSQLIAKTLDEFSRSLKDTELPNDAESTQAILIGQKSERDSIKEDFRIAVRRGFSLLKNVRQVDIKPSSELLSPTRLQNVTSIERMLIQLEETEKNFDKFWYKHEQRLQKCLQLRRFEDDFRKLQANFAQHMLYLEENREVGDTVDVVNALIASHKTYMEKAEDDIRSSESLELRGQQLLVDQDKELLEGSLKPKCSELTRMREALQNALQRRLEILRLSKQMHEQISVANAWCTKGVELLTSLPLEAQTKEDSLDMQKKFDDFLSIGRTLQLDSLRLKRGPELKALILMTTTDSSALLNQVSVRIGDIKKMCESRKIFLQKNAKEKVKPVGAVSPQSNETKGPIRTANVSTSPLKRANSKASLQDQNLSTLATPASHSSHIPSPQSKVSYVIEELLKTEQIYVEELSSVVEHYLKPFENNFDANCCSSSQISNNSEINHSVISEDSSNANFNYQRQSSSSSINNNRCLLFGNLADIRRFHAENFCRDLKSSVLECFGGGFEKNFDSCDYSKLSCGKNLATVRPIARCFLQNRANFYLYNIYCQNKPRSDALRAEMGDCHPFFLYVKFFNFFQRLKNAGHMLPLGAYLLKPVQRITKYQLLLKELAKHSKGIDGFEEIELALSSMLELLQRLNASMYQTFISGYPGDLVGLGQILLQAKFSVWSHRKQHDKTLRLRRAAKVQHRHVFLYPQAILFCKYRRQSPPFQEYFEYKSHLTVNNLGLSEHVKGNSLKFELWTEGRQEIYQMQPVDAETKNEWVTKVKGLIAENFYSSKDIFTKTKLERPVSWNSQTSTESNRSSRELSVVSDIMDR